MKSSTEFSIFQRKTYDELHDFFRRFVVNIIFRKSALLGLNVGDGCFPRALTLEVEFV